MRSLWRERLDQGIGLRSKVGEDESLDSGFRRNLANRIRTRNSVFRQPYQGGGGDLGLGEKTALNEHVTLLRQMRQPLARHTVPADRDRLPFAFHTIPETHPALGERGWKVKAVPVDDLLRIDAPVSAVVDEPALRIRCCDGRPVNGERAG